MTLARSGFADSLAPGFRQIFMDALKFGEKPSILDRVYNVITAPARQYVDDASITGFGLLSTKTEGEASTYDDIYQGYDYRYTFDTYSLAYRITKEMVEDELYGMMRKLPRSLSRSTNATIEIDAANMFNNGTSGSYTMSGGNDGLALYTATHTLVTGGTQKNTLSTAADLSPTSWEQAMIDIKDTTDDRGIPMNLKPMKLVYPNELAYTVRKLFGSSQDPLSGNNAVNPLNDEKMEFIEWNYLTDADQCYIMCDEHECNWMWRVKPDHYQGNDFDTDDAKFKVRTRWKRGWSSPWGTFCIQGA